MASSISSCPSRGCFPISHPKKKRSFSWEKASRLSATNGDGVGLSHRLCSVFLPSVFCVLWLQELYSVLRALAELMLGQEPCRAKLLESPEAMPAIISALGGS